MKSRPLLPLVAAAALGSSMLTGCGAFSDGSADSGSDVSVQITASIYPIAFVAERVAGDLADVEMLAKAGADAHDDELSISATASIADADLVVFSHGLQPSVDEAVEVNATGTVLDAAEVVDLLPATDDHDEHGEDDEDGHDEDEGDDHEGDEEDEHDHGEFDPHFWLDPLLMADLGDAVADRLAEIDETHAETFRANATDLRTDLESLDTAFSDGLSTCTIDTVVVSHDAFGYLDRYGLHFEPVAGLSPDAEPSPAARAALERLIGEEGITTVFSERLASPRLTEALAKDAGITTAILDPLEGLGDEVSDEDYLSLMQQNLDALMEANQCR